MKQYIPMSADYFLFMSDDESQDSLEGAFERAKALLARRPGDQVLVLKVEKILKAADIAVETEEVPLEEFKTRDLDDPFLGLFAEVDEGEDEKSDKEEG